MSFGIQLSVELTRAFPIGALIENAGIQVLDYARDLRKSGSDIVVEADLVEVFGRGKIVPEIERKFRDVVKVRKCIPLRHGCEISLDSGPGPTTLQAFRDSRYFTLIIQLSFLGWTHDRASLALAISQSMMKRFEAGVVGASASPSSEGISNTLAACSSQSSALHGVIIFI